MTQKISLESITESVNSLLSHARVSKAEVLRCMRFLGFEPEFVETFGGVQGYIPYFTTKEYRDLMDEFRRQERLFDEVMAQGEAELREFVRDTTRDTRNYRELFKFVESHGHAPAPINPDSTRDEKKYWAGVILNFAHVSESNVWTWNGKNFDASLYEQKKWAELIEAAL